ncbi:MAG TPA: LysR substrate-binding domain-containing protein [Polyangiales bacterium]|nr:LysR substrate-binding domain-containing protein [Polyangiales bacterium]
MQTTPYARLPAIASLIAFVEAARELSFKRAAQRVHVSPSALTRQIQSLEEQLGCALFVRANPGLELTPEGARYLEVVRSCLDRLRDVQSALQPSVGPLRLSSLASFTEQWLIPHLPEFTRAHPDIELEIEATLRYADFDRDPVDAAIRFGNGDWGELHSQRLVELTVVSVCSPELLEREPPLRTPADLARHTLIHMVQVLDAWPRWLKEVGLPELAPAGALRFDHVALALSAAESGLGVALCPRLLCARKLAEGTLVSPFEHAYVSADTYHFVCRPEGLRDRRILALRDWLSAALAAERG